MSVRPATYEVYCSRDGSVTYTKTSSGGRAISTVVTIGAIDAALDASPDDQRADHDGRHRGRRGGRHPIPCRGAVRIQPPDPGAAPPRGVAHLPPQGSSMPIVLSNLACWIAWAGSTPFGHTAEHSPTKLQSQMASEPVIVRSRSWPAWSLESRSYRLASAIAAGPTKSGATGMTGQAE